MIWSWVVIAFVLFDAAFEILFGLAGMETKPRHYGAWNVLHGCIVLAICYGAYSELAKQSAASRSES